MNLAEYFQNVAGVGVLATANKDGEVDAAIFSTPHVLENRQVAFIMRDRLTHKNLQSNPFAMYLFMEEGALYKGTRLFLKKTGEDTNTKLINKLSRRRLPPDEDKARGQKFLVYFEITKTLPLVGTGEEHICP